MQSVQEIPDIWLQVCSSRFQLFDITEKSHHLHYLDGVGQKSTNLSIEVNANVFRVRAGA